VPLAQLQHDPTRFSFDATVRLLTFDRHAPDPAAAARYTATIGAAFPGGDIAALEAGKDGAVPRLTVSVVALTGPAGMLPRHYSDAVAGDRRTRANSLGDFLDLIAHRMVAAYAAAGVKYRPQRSADTEVLAGGLGAQDRQAAALLALTGFGLRGMVERLPAGESALRHYAGLFAAHPRSADRLEALASDWLGRPVLVLQFAGGWLTLPPAERTRLPRGLAPGAFNRLGEDAAIGVRTWDQHARIMLQIGPLDRQSFERLLPDRPALRDFVSLVRAFVGFELEFAVNLVLASKEASPLALRFFDDSAGIPPRLGWNTWLSLATQRSYDAADAVFSAEFVEAS
jgi:type VI secretion system protein ImpH